MAKNKNSANPFYVLLVIVGIVFTVTACAYGVLTVRAIRPDTNDASESGAGLMAFLDRHGVTVLLIELAIMGVATFGAIGFDEMQMRRESEETKPDEARDDTEDGKRGSS